MDDKHKNCEDAKESLARFALNELDSEQARAIREHLDQCKRCAKSYESTKNAINNFKGLSQIPTSSQRRIDTKAVMMAERDKTITGSFKQEAKPLRFLLLASAAAVAIFTLIYMVFKTPQNNISCKITAITGKAFIRSGGQYEWKKASEGDVLSLPVELKTNEESVLRLAIYGNEPEASIDLNHNSSIALSKKDKQRRIKLNEGEFFISVSTDDPSSYYITDNDENKIALNQMIKAEISVKGMFTWTTPESIKAKLRLKNHTLGFDDVNLSIVCSEITRVCGTSVEPATRIVGDRKIVFYTNSNDKNVILNHFEDQLRQQDLVLVPTKEGYRVNATFNTTKSKKLFCRLVKGIISLNGQEVSAGQECFVDPAGQVGKRNLDSIHIAQWKMEGYYDNIAKTRFALVPVTIVFKGRKDGKLLYEITVSNTNLEIENYTVSIPEHKSLVSQDQNILSLPFKFNPK